MAGYRGGRLNRSQSELLSSYMHLHCNRILLDDHHMQEGVMYEFLLRYYRSRESDEVIK